MTEAVILALITLVGVTVSMLLLIAIVMIVLRANPTSVLAKTSYGEFKVEFDSKVDE